LREDNHWYSHSHAINAYIGRWSRPRPIWGTVLHGWFYDYPVLGGLARLRAPEFCWNSRHLRQGQERGAPIEAIGAPFLYGIRALRIVPSAFPKPRGTLAIPAQQQDGLRGERLRKYLEAIEVEFPAPYLFSVLPRDYDRVDLTVVANRPNWEVVSNGQNLHPWFMFRMLWSLSRVSHVVGTSLGSQLFYAAYLGQQVSLMPIEEGLSIPGRQNELTEAYPDLAKELFGVGLVGREAHDQAASELGEEFLQSPDRLVDTLGLTGPRQVAARVARVALRTHHGGPRELFDRDRIDTALRVHGDRGRRVTALEQILQKEEGPSGPDLPGDRWELKDS